jgi:RNA recognition motif-containing protein
LLQLLHFSLLIHAHVLQRNLDASTLTKDEVIQLLEKTDAISAQSDAPKVEQSEASEDPSSSAVVAATDAQDTTSSSVVAPPPAEHVDPTSGEPIRTLYVGSCPPSLSERELYQVFNRFVGYESSYLYHSNGKVSAFVTFSSAEFAAYAVAFCRQHGGFPLDPFLILVLDVQLANQNSNRKRRADQYYPAEVGYAYAAARPVSAPLDNYGYGSGSSYYGGYPTAAASSGIPGYENYTQVADLASAAYTSGKSSSRMPPSATLFISYITDETSVDDLRAVFGQMVGFRAARKTTMRGAPCAFIEFDNDRNSTIAMNIMQGQCLRPTDRGGLRIEYAKPTLNPTKTAASVPLPVNNGAYVGAYAGSSGRW